MQRLFDMNEHDQSQQNLTVEKDCMRVSKITVQNQNQHDISVRDLYYREANN